MSQDKKVYAFVGIPSAGSIYSRVVENADVADTVERELDDMMDALDGSRRLRQIWAVFPVSGVSFADACRRFGEYMEDEKNSPKTS